METRSVELTVPADPANFDSETKVWKMCELLYFLKALYSFVTQDLFTYLL